MHIREFQHYNDLRNHTREWDLPRWSNATAGEIGEMMVELGNMIIIANTVKKIDRDGIDNLNEARERLGAEMGGILSYLCMFATRFGIDLESAAAREFNAVSDRPRIKNKIYIEEYRDKDV